jgi:hypothetical protein
MNPENTDGFVQMRQVQRVLNEGGQVKCDWNTGAITVVSADGVLFSTMDGRTYQGFLKTLAPKLQRTDTGRTETKDLVIEWRKGE